MKYMLLVALVFLSLGMLMGMLMQQAIFQTSMVKFGESLNGVSVKVEFNETELVDRASENVKNMLWEIRMQNCTLTEKNYCALECYENKKLIPCQNFTGDDHFCDNGICKINGVCPDYYQKLEGLKVGDCF